MISVAELTVDADLGGQLIQIFRYQNTGSFQLGGYAESPVIINVFCVVQPASSEDLRQVPEGDRVEGSISIWCPQRIYRTTKSGTSDEVVWLGAKYRISGAWKWEQGGFWHAVGLRIEGE